MNEITIGNKEFRYGTQEEVDKECITYLKENVWACSAQLLGEYIEGAVEAIIELAQKHSCDDANDAILAMLGDNFDEFAKDVIRVDGAGSLLSYHDGVELDGVNVVEYVCDDDNDIEDLRKGLEEEGYDLDDGIGDLFFYRI